MRERRGNGDSNLKLPLEKYGELDREENI